MGAPPLDPCNALNHGVLARSSRQINWNQNCCADGVESNPGKGNYAERQERDPVRSVEGLFHVLPRNCEGFLPVMR